MGNQTFNPAQFVDMEINQPLEKRPPLPVGDYLAIIGEVTCVPWQNQAKGTSGLRYVVPLTIQVPPATLDELGIDPKTVIKLTDSIMLDLNDQGGLDLGLGKNSGLRRYREALDMNKPGDTFSPRKMMGQPILVKLTHEMYQDQVQERIGGVTKPQ